jgi:precorrin-4 methylase
MIIDIIMKGITQVESAAASLRLQAMPKVPQLVVLAMVEDQE